MWCQDIILFNAEQGRRDAKDAMLEVSEPEWMPTSSVMWMCTLLNRCIPI